MVGSIPKVVYLISNLSWSYCIGLRRTFWDPKVISCDLFWTQKVLIHISLTLSTGLLVAYLWPNKQKKLGLKLKNRAFYGIQEKYAIILSRWAKKSFFRSETTLFSSFWLSFFRELPSWKCLKLLIYALISNFTKRNASENIYNARTNRGH